MVAAGAANLKAFGIDRAANPWADIANTDLILATGIVGACGGVGGFLLPSSLGWFKEVGGSYGLGFAAFAMAATGAAIALAIAQREWQQTRGGFRTEAAPG